jgi:hypothetical protein
VRAFIGLMLPADFVCKTFGAGRVPNAYGAGGFRVSGAAGRFGAFRVEALSGCVRVGLYIGRVTRAKTLR